MSKLVFHCLARFVMQCLLIAGMTLSVWSSANAENIESIMAPGKLIEGHVKIEDECKNCHVKANRKAQDGLCMDCHKNVGSDVRQKLGFHGRLEKPVCRTCHSDHKGRDLKTAVVDQGKFDHKKTDFFLKGKHEGVKCEKCHVSGKKWSEASHECSVCHKKDDDTKGHKGSLGTKCADCHSENTSWKEAKFDHDTTKFPLTGKHTDTKCSECHKDNIYKETPKDCYSCHKKNDEQKGHKGQFGEKCDTCHTTKAFKPSTFKHDTDTKYVLLGKHKTAECKACHVGNLYKDKLTQDCFSCHKKDDKHKGTLGKECASCHIEKSWKEGAKFDHQKTSFPLVGKHVKVECKECHKSTMFKEAPKECFGCHEKDDKHKANLGKDCVSCHIEKDWKSVDSKFNHDKTKFQIRNGHAKQDVKCTSCHKDLSSFRGTALTCISCHKKDDKHQNQLGEKCDTCHNDKAWKGTNFDHNRSRFPLVGGHGAVKCKSCHETLKFKDAPRDCFSCHKKDDKHKQKFGPLCDTCHNTRAWSIWTFDHNVKTKYKIEGSHVKVACDSCHKEVAPPGKLAAPLQSMCISCHREADPHNGTYGQRCDQCHQVESWKKLKSRAGLALLNDFLKFGYEWRDATWLS
jgi:hypothetical protein